MPTGHVTGHMGLTTSPPSSHRVVIVPETFLIPFYPKLGCAKREITDARLNGEICPLIKKNKKKQTNKLESTRVFAWADQSSVNLKWGCLIIY